ncbi:phosphatidylglycerol lysyltransferase domain-containing protein [Schlesneria sp. T3-172]|uniref:phosphatidylglycerol lysyltransferase domain-containing protein n=1 Tax=Schlesneria sphaerica TaxID=3373610 RepID=UPI0037C6A55E
MTQLSCELHTPVNQRGRLEEIAFQYGQAYDSYLATEGRLRQFWLRNGSAVIVYVRLGSFVHVQGGLLGPASQHPALLNEFKAFLERKRYQATFYNVADSNLELFRRSGFQVTKWGEEPILDLPGLTWGGGDFEWVRRQSNFCRRKGLSVIECCHDSFTPSAWAELLREVQSIADECLSIKPQRSDVTFFNGSVTPQSWGRRRLFVARSDHGVGRIEGFLICLPYDAGKQYAIDTYRRRLDAPRGVVPFLMQQAVEHLKQEGVRAVSLCLCPAVRTEKLEGDSWIIRRCLQFGFNYASLFFDMPGEYHFKSRFRPRFVPRYICHWPEASVWSMCSLIQLSGALNLDLNRLAGILWRRLVRPVTRRNLSTPEKQQQPNPAPGSGNLSPLDSAVGKLSAE